MAMAPGVFECLEGTITLREIGNQVYLEMEGDNWHCSVTLNQAANEGISDWFTCLKLSK